jgi:hypothetical protein
MATHRRGTSSSQWSVADLLRREGRLRPGPVGVRGLAVGGALVCTTVVAVSMAGEPENVVTSSEPEALPSGSTGPPSSADGSDFFDPPPPAPPAPWAALDSQAAASQPASPQPEPPSVPGTGIAGTEVVEPRTAGAERERDPARTTARDRPDDRDFPVSGAVDRSRGRHAAPPRLPDRGPQVQRDVIVRDEPSDDGREEKRRDDDITRKGSNVLVHRNAPDDDDGKRRAVADEHVLGAGGSDAAARDDTAEDTERDDHAPQDVEPDVDVPDQRHDDIGEPDRDDGGEPRDGSEQAGQRRTPDAVIASPRDRDEPPDRDSSDRGDSHRSEDRPDKEDADERDRAGSEDHDDLDESDEADEGQADRSDDDGGSEGRHRASE